LAEIIGLDERGPLLIRELSGLGRNVASCLDGHADADDADDQTIGLAPRHDGGAFRVPCVADESVVPPDVALIDAGGEDEAPGIGDCSFNGTAPRGP
jgi:hypothetical protein